jgi:hypothetical protein
LEANGRISSPRRSLGRSDCRRSHKGRRGCAWLLYPSRLSRRASFRANGNDRPGIRASYPNAQASQIRDRSRRRRIRRLAQSAPNGVSHRTAPWAAFYPRMVSRYLEWQRRIDPATSAPGWRRSMGTSLPALVAKWLTGKLRLPVFAGADHGSIAASIREAIRT